MPNALGTAATDRLPRVAILLATYNGAAFLNDQLDSIAAQTGVGRIDICASDDGSSDQTRTMLAFWQGRWTRGDFTVLDGPGQGYAANFRSLLTSSAAGADYFAFADQDDVWDVDKLAAAIGKLASSTGPALYLSRTRLIDESGKALGYSPLFSRPPGFRNAIVQSIGGGNTIVMNAAAFGLVAESARRTAFLSHDWWCYIICAGAGAKVIYDAEPHIGYRQHAGNVIGRNTGLAPRLKRLGLLLRGRFADFTARNLESLAACRDLLTPEALATIRELERIRAGAGPAAVGRLMRAGLYRQTAIGQLGLFGAAFLRKL
jgi:glycosyltransferase involved in cell wall biosynthesis